MSAEAVADIARLCASTGECDPGAYNHGFRAEDALAVLDAAGLDRGVVLSHAFVFGYPGLGYDEHTKAAHTRRENEYIAEQVARAQGRLTGFFSVNPLDDHALDEISFWLGDGRLVGLKLHFTNSDVDLRDAAHLARLREVFALLDDAGAPAAVHVRTRASDYGARDMDAFLDVIEEAPDCEVSILHAGGWGGYGPNTDQALGAIERRLASDAGLRARTTIGLGGVLRDGQGTADTARLVARINAIGPDRFLLASDWDGVRQDTTASTLARLDALPGLSELARTTIHANLAPYLAQGAPRAPFELRTGQLPPELEARIDTGLAGYIDVANIPSVSVGIVRDGALVYAKSFGYANRAAGVRASPDTIYYIASVSKTFTATLALMLEEEGLVELDAPLARYLPDSVAVPADPAGQREITLSDLIAHTAGLPDDPPNRRNLAIDDPLDPVVWDEYWIEDLYDALAQAKLIHPVGSRWSYSSFGYALLGHALERAAGMPFAALLEDRLLEPLGLSNTAVDLPPDQAARSAAFYWTGDTARRERVHARFGDVSAFGGITSTVNDLARFVAFFLAEEGDANLPLSRRGIQRMLLPRVAVDEVPYPAATFQHQTLSTAMSLGWWVWDGEGVAPVYEHAGELDGQVSGVWLSPAHRTGVIVLANTGSHVGVTALRYVQGWLMDLLLAERSVPTP